MKMRLNVSNSLRSGSVFFYFLFSVFNWWEHFYLASLYVTNSTPAAINFFCVSLVKQQQHRSGCAKSMNYTRIGNFCHYGIVRGAVGTHAAEHYEAYEVSFRT